MSGSPPIPPSQQPNRPSATRIASLSHWYYDRRFEASVDFAASAGNYRGLMLTAAPNTGLNCHIVSLRLSVPAAARVVIGHSIGALTQVALTPLPVFAGGAATIAVLKAFTSAQASFVEDLTIFNHTLSWDWNHEYPFQVIGPSNVLMIGALASDISVSIGWLELDF